MQVCLTTKLCKTSWEWEKISAQFTAFISFICVLSYRLHLCARTQVHAHSHLKECHQTWDTARLPLLSPVLFYRTHTRTHTLRIFLQFKSLFCIYLHISISQCVKVCGSACAWVINKLLKYYSTKESSRITSKNEAFSHDDQSCLEEIICFYVIQGGCFSLSRILWWLTTSAWRTTTIEKTPSTEKVCGLSFSLCQLSACSLSIITNCSK